jgi:HSP20 family molecular chaperone IbpA
MSQLALLQDTFTDLDRQFQRLESDMNSMLRQWGLPSRWEATQELGIQPEIVGEGDNKKYRLNVQMGENFSPENVKVSLKDRLMTVEAKQEQKSDDGNTRVYQEVQRIFTLPENVEVKDVKSVLNPDGVLTIEAPIHERALPEPPKPKEIPVLMEK